MTHLQAMLLVLAGFVALALSQPRHQRELFGRSLAAGEAPRVRVAGWALLAVALAVDMAGLGGGYGAVSWCAHLSLGAWLTIALLHWRRR